MNLLDEYYQYCLEKKSFSKEKEIVFEIMEDFTDRRGLKQEWHEIDDDIKEEIIETWINIVKSKTPIL